jgi:hypothetical protein
VNTLTAPTEPRVHPGQYEVYPPGTPELEQLPCEFRDHQHTAATWEAFIGHPSVVEADGIFVAVQALGKEVAKWLKTHGELEDPGVHAIESAGQAVPEYLRTYGSSMQYVTRHFRGLAWALQCVEENLHDSIPDTSDEQNAPANVNRLLGLDEPAGNEGRATG